MQKIVKECIFSITTNSVFKNQPLTLQGREGCLRVSCDAPIPRAGSEPLDSKLALSCDPAPMQLRQLPMTVMAAMLRLKCSDSRNFCTHSEAANRVKLFWLLLLPDYKDQISEVDTASLIDLDNTNKTCSSADFHGVIEKRGAISSSCVFITGNFP